MLEIREVGGGLNMGIPGKHFTVARLVCELVRQLYDFKDIVDIFPQRFVCTIADSVGMYSVRVVSVTRILVDRVENSSSLHFLCVCDELRVVRSNCKFLQVL